MIGQVTTTRVGRLGLLLAKPLLLKRKLVQIVLNLWTDVLDGLLVALATPLSPFARVF